MRRGLLVLLGVAALALPVAPPTLSAATESSDDSLFAPLPQGRSSAAPDLYDVDLPGVARSLRRGVLELPTLEGGTETFDLRSTEVMEPALASAHPELQTYAGVSVDDPTVRVAVDVTPLGLSAFVHGSDSWSVEPVATAAGQVRHGVRATADVQDAPPLSEPIGVYRSSVGREPTSEPLVEDGGAPVEHRTYRLALLNDPTYADHFGSENVLAAKVSLVNRVNQIYNDDHGIRFLLVEGTEQLNLDTWEAAVGSDGPCGAHPCFDASMTGAGMLDRCGIDTIGRTRLVLGNLVGASAYDVGHLVLGVNGGGVAYLGVAGRDYAGGGCTALDQPRGDFFYVDYVSHELGHQFGADHTFDGSGDFCESNATDSSVEPGSGSSVMAYAGICGSDDLQPHTDPYFSQRSITEVARYTGASAEELGDVVEVQQVSLTGFDQDGDTVTLRDGDREVTLTRGSDYTRLQLQTAIAELTGRSVRIAGWDHDPFLDRVGSLSGNPGSPSDGGFQVVFSSSLDPEVGGEHEDLELLEAEGGDGVTARVVEIARGGAPRHAGAVETADNRRPTVTAPRDVTIPVRTPFKLKGRGVDADGDALTYTWEQNDAGSGAPLTSNRRRSGPLFRIFSDNASVSGEDALESPSPGQNVTSSRPVRRFPDLEQILHGRTNAATGRCPRVSGSTVRDRVLDCYSELLPARNYQGAAGAGDRTMHFRLTARDGAVDGGATAFDDVALRVKRDAGPFLVASHHDGATVRAGRKTTVSWDVNGTRALARKVRIRLSTDGGATWRTVLAKNTRNDGRKRVRIPAGTVAHEAWVMVEARGNYFFDVNDEAFRIR